MNQLFVFIALALAHCRGVQAQGFYPPDPAGVPTDFVCAWRGFAAEYSAALRPDSAREAFDAAQLATLCNRSITEPVFAAPAPPRASHRGPSAPPLGAAGGALYVDGVAGSDSNSGSIDAPLRTAAAGLARSRALARPATLFLRAATYYLDSTLELSAADSGLTIAAYNGEAAWLSGARLLPPLTWEPFLLRNASDAPEVFAGENNARGCAANAPFDATCGCSPLPALSACAARFVATPNATSFTYHDASLGAPWALQCCLRHDALWQPYPEAGHSAGRRGAPALNVWRAPLALGGAPVPTELRVDGARVPRARFPNANPETQQFPQGWVTTGGSTWHAPRAPGAITPVNVFNAEIALRASTENTNYSGAIGGPCAGQFDPPFSYWCAEKPAGGGGFQYYVPSGVTLAAAAAPPAFSTPPANPPVMHVWRASHWASWMFVVDSYDNVSSIEFGIGGFQGARGGPGSDWYVENAIELLDAPTEWFFDAASQSLIYFHNASVGTPPPPSTLFEAPALLTLLRVNASQAAPARDVRLSGLGFRDSAPSFLEPHATPSGGDWALERIAAVFFEGVERLVVDNCSILRPGGNGLMMSGYSRDALLANNSVRWVGGTAFAAWGRTDEMSDGGVHGFDATAGDFPQRTTVSGNFFAEIGVWEKQASCWFQAKAAQTTLVGNVCFNGARAGFNFNDGLGGGDEVHFNSIFNMNRESSDHGAINSWDRQPFVTSVFDGVTPSARMLPRNISNNFLSTNYGGGNGAVDNDDGSLWFANNHNFAVYGHQKFKVGAIQSYGNVLAYVTDFGGKWAAPGEEALSPNSMHDNKVIFLPNVSAQYHDCSWNGTGIAARNALYGPSVVVSGARCPKSALSLAEWQALDPENNDVGSTWSAQRPAADAIVAMGRVLVGM
jgi:hypothetical protein